MKKASSKIPFSKMQGLGNDFVVINAKDLLKPLTPLQIRRIADRRLGIGFDQLILIHESDEADTEISFFNADGGKALACGNGTRCVAKYLNKKSGSIQTPSFLSKFKCEGDQITVSLREPLFASPIPLPYPLDKGYCVDVGNPHLIIFVDDLDKVSLKDLAPNLQPPEGVNIELAKVISPARIKIKVWERGAGITPACGSGASAVGAMGLKLGLVKKSPVVIEMDGGSLNVDWKPGTPLYLTGPAEFCYNGTFELT